MYVNFFRPPDPKSKKKSRKSTNKKNRALYRNFKIFAPLFRKIGILANSVNPNQTAPEEGIHYFFNPNAVKLAKWSTYKKYYI